MKFFMTALALCVALSPALVRAESVPYKVSEFRAIDVRMGISVDVTIAPEYEVTAEAITGDLAQFRIKEYLPWLAFARDTRWLIFSEWRDDAFAVDVKTPVLNGLKAFEDATATFAGDAGERLWIEAGTGGAITVSEVIVGELTLLARAGGTISAVGTCDRLTIRNEGHAIDASGLDCSSIVVNGDPAGVTLAPGALTVAEHPALEG